VPESEDYKRGHDAGGIAERLDSHDRHFALINGSLADMVREIHGLALALQRLADQAVARDATVLTTAAALKEAEEARRDKTEQGWAPWQKALAVVAGLVAVAGLIVTLIVK
jgi:hypothetical protein